MVASRVCVWSHRCSAVWKVVKYCRIKGAAHVGIRKDAEVGGEVEIRESEDVVPACFQQCA